MKKYNYYFLLPILATAISGFFISGFLGGFISGASVSVLIFSTLGKWLHIKSASRIEKSLRDHILLINSQKDEPIDYDQQIS